jgi:predicted ATP-grasp superfamily ATP-dependent carboligase
MRLEQFCPGCPASLAVLGGPGGQRVFLPPCRQILSDDGRFSYLGGQVIEKKNLSLRAQTLGAQAVSILDDWVGYVGIDFILGVPSDGSADTAVELNPRLTTSYIGLRHAIRENLAQVMLDLAEGAEVKVTRTPRPICFDTAGNLS